MKSIFVTSCLVFFALSVDPPLFDKPYQISLHQTVPGSGESDGQYIYDPLTNRSRIDRANSISDHFCNTVLPHADAQCLQYTVNEKHWVAYPQKQYCCFCCDARHGCGFIKPDWLKDATYLGRETVDGEEVDKWNKNGSGGGYNHVWVRADDSKVLKKFDMAGQILVDFDEKTYERRQTAFPDSVFALPPYCNQHKPQDCPRKSICGYNRQKVMLTQVE